MISRRAVLLGVGTMLMPPGCDFVRAESLPRIAVLDWGLASTCVALGCVPAGIPAPVWYGRYAVEPAMPPRVTDVGLLFTPNLEALQALKPETIVIPSSLEMLRRHLSRIATVFPANLYRPGPDSYSRAADETGRLADHLGCGAAAKDLKAQCDAALAEAGRSVRPYDGRPIYVVSILDDRHVNVYGPDSLFHDILGRLGLRNAWDRAGALEFATVGFERLTEVPDARIIAVAAGSGDRLLAASSSSLWRALPQVQGGRVVSIGAILPSAGLPAARRFARLMADALSRSADR